MKKIDFNLPYLAIIGRPNVGKSSLYNAMTKSRSQITHDIAGTTRDRQEILATYDDKTFILADTGGMIDNSQDHMDKHIKAQIDQAVERSTLIIFVCNVKEGIHPIDKDIASYLRQSGKPVVLAVNKVDTSRLLDDTHEFYNLNFGEPIATSAIHRRGITELLRVITDQIDRIDLDDEKYIRIALAGRPNVGKSSLVNYLLNQDRVIVSDSPGTTRDSIDTYFQYKSQHYIITDTAGIRGRRRIKGAVDGYSTMRSFEAIKKSSIIFILIDAKEGIAKDDKKIIDFVYKNGKCALFIINKWDLVKEFEMQKYTKYLEGQIAVINKAPVVFASCKTGRNIDKILEVSFLLQKKSRQNISSSRLNKILPEINRLIPKRIKKKKILKLYYLLQSGKAPLKFLATVNDKRLIDKGFRNSIENILRRRLDLDGVSFYLDFVSKHKKERK